MIFFWWKNINYINPISGYLLLSIVGIDSSSLLIQWFWEVMEEFTNQERSLFLRFVWGRTRLPRTIADFRGRDFVIQILDKYTPPDHFLPESYTCFFLLKMPRYSCKVSNKFINVLFLSFLFLTSLNFSACTTTKAQICYSFLQIHR